MPRLSAPLDIVGGREEPPASTSSVPPTRARFRAVSTHEALVAWSVAYARRVVRTEPLAVDLDRVDWEVSTRAKRRAAAVKRPKIPEAAVGSPLDWSGVRRPSAPTESPPTPSDGPRRCTVSLTWDAAREFSVEEWKATLRHELIHVEQFQRFGTTDHGPRFERRATELDTPVRCRRFATPKYVLSCSRCADVVARRYRDCKLVREHGRYRSSCCEASLRCDRVKSK